MEQQKIAHLVAVPFTGLGAYHGFRGNAWLRNRIAIFKQFVIPALLNQTDQDFILWVAWRREERTSFLVVELEQWLIDNVPWKIVFTYSGVFFWDDKYPDGVAHDRLANCLRGAMPSLINAIGPANTILLTLQPSDDCYAQNVIYNAKQFFKKNPTVDVYGHSRGYVCNYKTLDLAYWNPETTPPFYTIKYTRENFTDEQKHMQFTGPYKSHEYLKDHMRCHYSAEYRAFLVGTHEDNISTVFDHPYARPINFYKKQNVLRGFSINHDERLIIPFSLRRKIFSSLSYEIKRKLRYYAEKNAFISRLYNFLRG